MLSCGTMDCSNTDENMPICMHKSVASQMPSPSSCHSSPSRTASQIDFMEDTCSRPHVTSTAQDMRSSPCKKLRRPVAYQGDPDSASLTAVEKVQIKRRIINRESARRLRVRRQANLDVLQAEVAELRSNNDAVKHTLMARRRQQREWTAQLTEAQQAWEQADAEGLQLTAQVSSLRRQVQAGMTKLQRCDQKHAAISGSCMDSPDRFTAQQQNSRQSGHSQWADASASVKEQFLSCPSAQYCSPTKKGSSQSSPDLPISSHRSEGSTNMPFPAGPHGSQGGSTMLRELLTQQIFTADLGLSHSQPGSNTRQTPSSGLDGIGPRHNHLSREQIHNQLSKQQLPHWEAAKSLDSHSWNQDPRISNLHAADIHMLSSKSHTKPGAQYTLQCDVHDMGKAQFELFAHKQDGSMPNPGSNNHQQPQQDGCTTNGSSNAHAHMSQHSHCAMLGGRHSPFQPPLNQSKCSVTDMPFPRDQQLPQQNSSSVITRSKTYTHQPAMTGNSKTLFGSQPAGEPSNQKCDTMMHNSNVPSHSQGATQLSKQKICAMMHSSDLQFSAYKQHTCTMPGTSNTQFDSQPARQLSNDSSAQTYMRQPSYGSEHTLGQGCKMDFAPQLGSPRSLPHLHAEEGVHSPPANQRNHVQLALQWNPQPNSHLNDVASPELGDLLQMGQAFLPDVHPLEYDALM